jgi:hypothetical protein
VKRFVRPTRRFRLRLALLAVLALLFQQVALASYLCSPADIPANNVAMSTHCDEMPMVKGNTPAKATPVLCAQHCAQQTATTQDARLPNVPPLLLPALLPAAPAVVISPAQVAATRDLADARRTPGLPPALRYRVLLI